MIVRALPRDLAFSACQWSTLNLPEMVTFCSPHPCVLDSTDDPPRDLILTLPFGAIRLSPSDWAVKSPRNELLAYPDDTFHAAFMIEE